MFQKSKLAFTDKAIFEVGFKPSLDRAFCVVSKMLFYDKVRVDGSVDDKKAGQLRKYELWSYIYYLYYYNNSVIKEFYDMKNPDDGKASAYMFYSTVRNVVGLPFVKPSDISPLDVTTLIYFINLMVYKYKDNLKNPVVDYLQRLLTKTNIEQIKRLTIVTGKQPGNIVVVTNPKDVEEADIKINFNQS